MYEVHRIDHPDTENENEVVYFVHPTHYSLIQAFGHRLREQLATVLTAEQTTALLGTDDQTPVFGIDPSLLSPPSD